MQTSPKNELDNINSPHPMAIGKKYIYGIHGLAALLNCSRVTAQRIKTSGKVPFRQLGRIIIFEETAVINAMDNQTKV